MALVPPENRAVAPTCSVPWTNTLLSTAPAPIPPPSAMSLSDNVPPLQQGKCRTLQGPSATEWAKHRETIIGLYRQFPLKRVSEIMRKHYAFSASKRMYDKRFREWNVFKNVNGDERAKATRRPHSSASGTDPQGNGSNFSQDDLRRTMRYARAIQQGVRSTPTTKSLPGPVEGRSNGYRYPDRQARRSISISDLLKAEDIPEKTAIPQSPTSSEGPQPGLALPSSPWSDNLGNSPSPSMDSAEEDLKGCHDSNALSAPYSPGASLVAYRDQLQRLFKAPPPSISPDMKTRTMGAITLKLREYCDWQLDNVPEGVLPDDFLGHKSSDESVWYWNTIKNAIYLVKISAGSLEDVNRRPDRQAWSAFAEAGCLAAGAMTTHPFDFLRNLFATLSPANTSARPELRSILLRFLASEAQTSFSPNHPVTQICKELQHDEGCQEISQRSLQCMLDIFNSRLGRSRAITFKLLDSLATLLRRSGEYHAGLEIITELLDSSRSVFGPDSDQARTVENELAHFYMLADESDLALAHCMSVVTRPQTSSSSTPQSGPTFHQDGIAAHTMEDIAEIYQRRGDMEQCITWLERAASIALVVWGPKSIATSHLVDKMTSLQRQFGKDLLKSATLWEAALA